MCLMCEVYVALCTERECYVRAPAYDRYETRRGDKMYLWRGYGEPCEHILATHSPDCSIRVPDANPHDERSCDC